MDIGRRLFQDFYYLTNPDSRGFHVDLLLGLPLSSSLLLEYSSEYLNEYSSTR